MPLAAPTAKSPEYKSKDDSLIPNKVYPNVAKSTPSLEFTKGGIHYDIGYNNEPLATLWHVVYATLGSIEIVFNTGQGLILFTNAGLNRTRCRPGRPLPPM